MTSEFDIPGGLIVQLRKRTQDPVILAGLDLLMGYLSSLHEFSHNIGRGTYKAPKDFMMGYVQLPKTDHWASTVPYIAASIHQMDTYYDQLLELERQAEKKRAELEAKKKEIPCFKENHGFCLCPKCEPRLHQNE